MLMKAELQNILKMHEVRKKLFYHLQPPGGVNFTNILQATFTGGDPKSANKLLNLTVFCALLGSAGIKAARKHVGEIDPCKALVTLKIFCSLHFTISNFIEWKVLPQIFKICRTISRAI